MKWGNYWLERLIAVGGMAEVFEATKVGSAGVEKKVCLKRIREDLSKEPEFIDMFIREARIAMQLQHTNIINVFEFDCHDGQYFMAMEYIDGLDLWHILRDVTSLGLRIPTGFALHVMTGLLEALGHAHSQTELAETGLVIHRDVSPHNVLVSREGVVKLADFGIAKAQGLRNNTRAGVIKGKLAYLSPEQAGNKELDARSDLFSAGLILHEMLTGERLFKDGDEKAMIEQAIEAPIPVIPGLSAELNAFLTRILKRDPAERYQSAPEAADALRDIVLPGYDAADAGLLVANLLKVKEQADFLKSTKPMPLPEKSPRKVTEIAGDRIKQSVLVTRRFFKKPLATGALLTFLAIGAVFLAFGLKRPTPSRPPIIADPHPARTAANRQMKDPDLAGPPIVKLMARKESSPAEPMTTDQTAATDKKDQGPKKSTGNRTVQTGLLDVNVRPWAEVAVDGITRGTTPISKLRLTAGAHRLTLSNSALGYRQSFRIQVRPGKKTVINRKL